MRVGHTFCLTFQAKFKFEMKKFEDMMLHELCVECFGMTVNSANDNNSGVTERTHELVMIFFL